MAQVGWAQLLLHTALRARALTNTCVTPAQGTNPCRALALGWGSFCSCLSSSPDPLSTPLSLALFAATAIVPPVIRGG